MNLLALDLGTRTGWCLREAERITSGVQKFELGRGESPGMRYIRFTRWLDEVGHAVKVVAYESAHQRGGAATEVAAGFATHVQAWCALRGIEHVAVHTGTLKKYATGHGKSDKTEMLHAVRQRWKPDVISDDEADAVALLYYTLEKVL